MPFLAQLATFMPKDFGKCQYVIEREIKDSLKDRAQHLENDVLAWLDAWEMSQSTNVCPKTQVYSRSKEDGVYIPDEHDETGKGKREGDGEDEKKELHEIYDKESQCVNYIIEFLCQAKNATTGFTTLLQGGNPTFSEENWASFIFNYFNLCSGVVSA
jgi:hypothetical protein